MSRARDRLNVDALRGLLGQRPPPRERPQPLLVAAPGAGGSAARPIDWASADGKIKLYAEAADNVVKVRLQDDCGSQVLLQILADGTAKVRVTGCDGAGYSLTPTGLARVTVTNPGQENESEAPTPGTNPFGEITVQACVDGVTKTLHLLGWVQP